ncbi:uncharacterized protein LOC134241731 [Saccostrea cucullata]|uniref:uncharacterized protein LOC134241731 n=1 Tax=Saccostrea cuccullata TaxID=36930 RepID=UPI002ED3B437
MIKIHENKQETILKTQSLESRNALLMEKVQELELSMVENNTNRIERNTDNLQAERLGENTLDEENTEVKCLIPTQNRYEMLSQTEMEKPDASRIRTQLTSESDDLSKTQQTEVKKNDSKIEILMDSHGKDLTQNGFTNIKH